MQRKILYWKLRDRELQLGERTLVMGILNITPDSFSDGGRYIDPEKAYGRALELQEAGADIIDIGAESTRPGSEPVSADEEWRRLVPLLRRLRGNLSVPVSLDTYKSETAERALAYDVHILNDPSGLTFDPALAKIAASENLGLILNHMRGRPEQWAKMGPLPDAIGTVTKELDAAVNRARHAGVDRQRIMVDPGIGFGKRKEQNSELIAQLGYLSKLDLPILVGVSRKSFLAQGTELETLFATAAAVTAAILNGAHLVRVHDVKEMLAVVRVADELARSAEHPAEIVDDRPARRVPAKMQAWEEEKPKPTRPPMKRVEAPISAVPQQVAEQNEPKFDVAAAQNEPKVEAVSQNEPELAAISDLNENPPEQKPAPQKPATTRDYPPARTFDRAPRRENRYPPSNRGAYPPSQRPFERSNDRPARREDRPAAGAPTDRPYNRPNDRSHDRPNDRSNDRPNSRPPFRRDDRPDNRSNDRPNTGRPPFRREDRPAAASGSGDRPFRKPGADRPFGKSFAQPGGDRPFSKPFSKPGGRPINDRSRGDRPTGDRPPAPWQQRSRPGDRPPGDRPQGDRPQGDRPFRSSGDRPQGDRPPGNRPPPSKFGPPRGGRPGGRPPNKGPGGPRKPFRRD